MFRPILLFALLSAAPALAEDLAEYVIVDGREIAAPLSPVEPDEEKGAALFATRGGCAACHAAPPGRDLTDGSLRLWLVAPSALRPGTEMPGYYDVGRAGAAPDDLVGRTRLTAEDIEHLIAFLKRP